MLGFFPLGGGALGDAGTGASTNGGTFTGISTLTATGNVAGTGSNVGTSTLVASGDVVGTALMVGSSVITAYQIMANFIGKSLLIGAGAVVGAGHNTGIAFASASGEVVGFGSVVGNSFMFAYAFYPAYTSWLDETLLFTFTGESINESDSAFDQAGRVIFCAEKTVNEQQEIWLYWFDPIPARFIFEKICVGRNPRVILDDPLNSITSDVLLFYVTLDEQRVCYRQQRDRYLIEYQTPLVKVPHSYIDLYIEDVVKGRDGRLVVIGAQRNIQKGTWNYIRLESALYPFVLDTDTFQAGAQFLNTSSLTLARQLLTIDFESFTAGVSFQPGGSLRSIITFVAPPGSLDPVGNPVPFYDDVEQFQASVSFLSGTFVRVVIPDTLFDVDQFQAVTSTFLSGTLVRVVIVINLFDIDQFQAASTFIASGSSLV